MISVKIITKLIFSLRVCQIYLWIFTSSLSILISSMIIILFSLRFIIFTFRKSQWCSILFIIFLIGGLIVSFFYIVRIDPNNYKIFKLKIFIFFFIFNAIFYFLNFHINFFFQLNLFRSKLNRIYENWKDGQFNYIIMIIFILLYLIIVILFVDKKLKICKSRIKNFN